MLDELGLSQEIETILIEKGMNLLLALITLFIGWWVIKYATRLSRRAMRKAKLEESLTIFLGKLLTFSLRLILIIMVISMMGVETTSLIALLGAAGLAVGLALQGSLSNFAGGVLILVFKPFKVDDIIETQGKMGTVEAIDILHTTIVGFDNKVHVAPNGELANTMITNLTRKDRRRVEIPIGISYSSNIQKARKIALDKLHEDDRILKDPEPVVWVNQLADSSVNLSIRCWALNDDVWNVYWDNIEVIKLAYDEESDITIPFPQRDVHLIQEKS